MRIITILCALAGVAMFAGTSSAQCRTGTSTGTCQPVARGTAVYTYPTTYQYPTYEVVVEEVITPVAVPVAVPVLVPAYQYTYVPSCQPVSSMPQPSAMPGMQPVANGPGSTDQERLRQMVRELLTEMQKPGGGSDDGPPVAWDVQPPVGTPGQPALNHVQVLSARCAECHTGAQAKGGVVIFSSPGVLNPQADRTRAIRAAEDGRMPPKAMNDPKFRLSPQEVASLRGWN